MRLPTTDTVENPCPSPVAARRRRGTRRRDEGHGTWDMGRIRGTREKGRGTWDLRCMKAPGAEVRIQKSELRIQKRHYWLYQREGGLLDGTNELSSVDFSGSSGV